MRPQLELVNKQHRVPVVPGGGGPPMGNREAQLAAEQDLYGNVECSGAYGHARLPSYPQVSREP